MSTLKVARTKEELKELLATPVEPIELIPALAAAAKDPSALRERPAVRMLEAGYADLLADAHNIPHLTYTMYRDVQRYTDRYIYQAPRREKYGKMAAVAFQVLLGNDEYINLLYDYIWSICEETIWILPQREDLRIDLRTAATIMDFSEIAIGMGHKLENRLIQRIRLEIERRVFQDYIDNHESRDCIDWWKKWNNWNGVCNGGVGAAFLLLEPDIDRLALALEIVLEGLQAFVDTAFSEDGASGEGTGYWMYGLSNFICFSEMLRIRTGGQLDFLSSERLADIARYPLTTMLSPGRFFAYSDCDEETALMPGHLQRLEERTGVTKLRDLFAEPADLTRGSRTFHNAWRDALWWDSIRPAQSPRLDDAYLASSGVTRLVSETATDAPVVLAAKAGHNAVPHNHNDIGSFVLHVDGETLLVDPERGLYDNYKLYGHDNVIFSNSFGHSLPVIGGAHQSKGREFEGWVTRFEPEAGAKVSEMEFHKAYEVEGLENATRRFTMGEGELLLEDEFAFTGEGLPVEEGFVTWNKTMVQDADAYVVGKAHVVKLSIEEPAGAAFELAVFEKESEENNKPVPLKRLSFDVPAGADTTARVRIKVLG